MKQVSAAISVFFVLVPFQALAQNPNCDRVLELTGRNLSITMDRQLREEFRASSSSSSSDRSVTYRGTNASRAESSSSSSQRYELWKRDYFQSLDTVFEPALDTWLDCINASTVQMRFRRASGRSLVVDFYAAAGGGSPTINGVNSHANANCAFDGHNGRFPIRLAIAPVTLRCSRTGSVDSESLPIDVSTSEKTFTLSILPYYAPSLRPSPGNFETNAAADIRGCNFESRLESVPYNRTVQFLDLTMRARAASDSAVMTASINGIVVARQSGLNEGRGSYVLRSPSGGHLMVPANTPAYLMFLGGTACQNMTGRVLVTRRP